MSPAAESDVMPAALMPWKTRDTTGAVPRASVSSRIATSALVQACPEGIFGPGVCNGVTCVRDAGETS